MAKDFDIQTKCPVCGSDLFARLSKIVSGPIYCFRAGDVVGWMNEGEETYNADWGLHSENGSAQDWSDRNAE